MTEPKVFSIQTVKEFAEKGEMLEKPHLKCVSDSKGCGSIIDIGLMIPESAVVFFAPISCARHVTVFPWHRTGRLFFIEQDDADIVNGEYSDIMDEVVDEILRRVKPTPKIITICLSCIDRLMVSDMNGIADDLMEKYHVKILPIWMDPIMKNKHPQHKVWESVFRMLNAPADAPRDRSVNSLGRLCPYNKDSELRVLLNMAGYGPVRHLDTCETLEEFQKMAYASLNIVGSFFGESSARVMQHRWGVPYVELYPTADPDLVSHAYREIENLLDITIEDQPYYQEVADRIETLKEKAKNTTFAVGESYTCSVNPFTFAKDLCKIGLNVKYIFSDGKIIPKVEEIRWLAENKPDVQVVLMSHPTMVKLLDEPLEVDIAIGTYEDWFYNTDKTKWITMEYTQHDGDYASIIRLIDRIEACIGE